MTPEELRHHLSDPELLRGLTQFVRSKVNDSDARDIAQVTLSEALASSSLPDDGNVKRWLFGIARHKLADHYRQRRQHVPLEGEAIAVSDEAPAESARDLLRWVNRQLPEGADAARTLEWMMREAEGDPLEAIAEEQHLAAPTVRQRVSRLRRHLRERWSVQLAAAALGMVVAITGYAWYEARRNLPVAPEVVRGPSKLEQAEELRRLALERCRQERYEECVGDLDRARVLDQGGDAKFEIQEARRRAVVAQLAAAAPSSSALSPSPSTTSSAPLPPPAPPAKRAPSKYNDSLSQIPSKKDQAKPEPVVPVPTSDKESAANQAPAFPRKSPPKQVTLPPPQK